MTAIQSSSLGRLERAKVCLLCSLLYPLLVLIGLADRVLSRATEAGAFERSPAQSLLAESADKVGVAISYALMARSMLQTCAQQSGPERLS